MGIRILSGGRKMDVPNVLVQMQALDAPFAHLVEGRRDGSNHSEFRFRVIGLVDKPNGLAWLERARDLDARTMEI